MYIPYSYIHMQINILYLLCKTMKTPHSSFVTLRTSTIFYTKREKYPNKPERQGICMPAYTQTKAPSARSMSSSLYFVASAAASAAVAAVAAFVAAAKANTQKTSVIMKEMRTGRSTKLLVIGKHHFSATRTTCAYDVGSLPACLRARIFTRLLPFRSRQRSNC